MGYHIYLDNEKCGELSDAENARLRKESRINAGTWVEFFTAQVALTWKLITFYLRMLGFVVGLGVSIGLICSPLIMESAKYLSAPEIAVYLQQTGIYLIFSAAFIVVSAIMFSPEMFSVPSAFEREYLRRVRKLKHIHRYGQLEVFEYTINSHTEQ